MKLLVIVSADSIFPWDHSYTSDHLIFSHNSLVLTRFYSVCFHLNYISWWTVSFAMSVIHGSLLPWYPVCCGSHHYCFCMLHASSLDFLCMSSLWPHFSAHSKYTFVYLSTWNIVTVAALTFTYLSTLGIVTTLPSAPLGYFCWSLSLCRGFLLLTCVSGNSDWKPCVTVPWPGVACC